MACRILRALILISMRLVGAQIWILGRHIGAWIVQRDGALSAELQQHTAERYIF